MGGVAIPAKSTQGIPMSAVLAFCGLAFFWLIGFVPIYDPGWLSALGTTQMCFTAALSLAGIVSLTYGSVYWGERPPQSQIDRLPKHRKYNRWYEGEDSWENRASSERLVRPEGWPINANPPAAPARDPIGRLQDAIRMEGEVEFDEEKRDPNAAPQPGAAPSNSRPG